MRGSAGGGHDLTGSRRCGWGGVIGKLLRLAKNSFVDFDRGLKILLEFKASLIAARQVGKREFRLLVADSEH